MIPELTGLILDGKYRLTVPLGQGGMGVVYAAEHVMLGKRLAVKLLKPQFASDKIAFARFQQEAVNASRIGNPHIIQVIDLGTAPDGSPFMVMEFLEGETLYALMMENPSNGTNDVLPLPRIADVLSQVLTGLQAAHGQGILHRDLKPGNVFLTRFGDRGDFVKLLDFGVSKVLGGDRVAHMTRTGVLLGTPTYMSPEQVMGNKDIDHRADLWSAGIILFRALAGRRPHEARSPSERLAAIATTDPPSLRRFRPDLSEDIDAIVRRALTRDRTRRFQTAEEFRDALAPYRGVPSGITASSSTFAPPPPVSSVPPAPPPRLPDSGPSTVPALAPPAAEAASAPPVPSDVPTLSGPGGTPIAAPLRPPGPPAAPAAPPPSVLARLPMLVASQAPRHPPAAFVPAVSVSPPSSVPPATRRSSLVPWISAVSLALIAAIAVTFVALGRHRSPGDQNTSTETAGAPPALAATRPSAAPSALAAAEPDARSQADDAATAPDAGPAEAPLPIPDAAAQTPDAAPQAAPDAAPDVAPARRAAYVATAAAAQCVLLDRARSRTAPTPAQVRRIEEAAARRHELTYEQWKELQLQLQGDPAVTAEVNQGIAACLSRAGNSVRPADAGIGPQGIVPDIRTTGDATAGPNAPADAPPPSLQPADPPADGFPSITGANNNLPPPPDQPPDQPQPEGTGIPPEGSNATDGGLAGPLPQQPF
jgi:serine/threonine protein kinase